ncbi:hypothetical protein [Rufibacter quisquiliarum]|uniref:Uncharacterized protein n=1 Tax=Rufibacter quisquiliarum TaxID=1549639 RepID=A0A839GKG6_9BACT|nr:hypothetical protein [Rufibacter quisquiliarum]MBA9076085.1 hypothetical protein [Rufibacter quisquiliarum]
MAKHTLTPEMDHALKQFAERLPEPEQQKPGVVQAPRTGAEILAENPEIRDKDGKPLNPEKHYYLAETHTRINHLRRLRKAFRKGGKDAVVEYLRPYEKFLHTPETEAAQ